MKKQANKFCGNTNCKLGFVHWHDKEGDVMTPLAPSKVEIIKNRKDEDVPVKTYLHGDLDLHGHDPITPPRETDPMAAKIAAAVAGLAASEDPSADRFKGKSSEETRLIVMQEHMQKWGDRVDRQNNITLGALTDFDDKVGRGLGVLTASFDALEKTMCNSMVEIRGAIDGEGGLADAFRQSTLKISAMDTQILDTREDIRKQFGEMIAGTVTAVEKLNKTVFDATSAYQQRADNAVRATQGLVETRVLPLLDQLRQDVVATTAEARRQIIEQINTSIRHQPKFSQLVLASMAGGALLVSGAIVIAGLILAYSHFWGLT